MLWEESHPAVQGVRLSLDEAVALGQLWWHEFAYLAK